MHRATGCLASLRGQYWGVQTIESFNTYGTPDIDGET
jgi:hypothetical protein